MTPTLELGDSVLDADHAKLARLIEDLGGVAASRLLETLDELHAHAREHFASEDRDLRESPDGNASCHMDEHAAVLKSLQDVRAIVQSDPGSGESRLLISRLVAELQRWLPEHVLAMDAGVANARSKRRLGGFPIVLARR